MKIGAISFRGYDPYPINGGKVEKLKYELEHGMREPSDTFESESPRCSSDEEQPWERLERWYGADDGDDWMDDDF